MLSSCFVSSLRGLWLTYVLGIVGDANQCQRVLAKLEAGTVWVNQYGILYNNVRRLISVSFHAIRFVSATSIRFELWRLVAKILFLRDRLTCPTSISLMLTSIIFFHNPISTRMRIPPRILTADAHVPPVRPTCKYAG